MEKGERIKGERRGRKRGWEKGEWDALSTLQIRLDTLLINRDNKPIYFINMRWH